MIATENADVPSMTTPPSSPTEEEVYPTVKFFELSEALGSTLQNKQMRFLHALWEAERQRARPGLAGLPPLESLAPEAHPWLAGDMIVVHPSVGGFHYDYYGVRIASKAGFDMTGRNTKDFTGDLSRFFAAKYRQSEETLECLYTMHHAQASQAVISWERLLLPVRAGAHPAIVCYNVPLQQKNSIYEAILESSLDGIVVIESSLTPDRRESVFRIVAINGAAERIFGVTNELAAGQAVEEVLPLEYLRLDDKLDRILETGDPYQRDVSISTTVGQCFYRMSVVRADLNIVITLADITALRQSESALQFQANELAQANEFLEQQSHKLADLAAKAERDRALALENSRLVSELFESLPMPVTYLGIDGVIEACNDRYAAILGRSRPEVVGQNFRAVFPTEVLPLIRRMNREILDSPNGRQTYELKIDTPEGGKRSFVVHRALVRDADENPIGIASALVDFTEEYELRSELERLATTDVLTGLYNRRFFTRRGREEVDRARRHGMPLSVVLCDIDRFKQVNDTLGHDGGDLVLKRFGSLMRDELRKAGDLMARYGGEEFIMLLPQTDLSGATVLADRLRRIFEADRIEIAGAAHGFTASFGVAELGASGAGDLDALVKSADEALYAAKAGGRNRVEVYDPTAAAVPE